MPVQQKYGKEKRQWPVYAPDIDLIARSSASSSEAEVNPTVYSPAVMPSVLKKSSRNKPRGDT